MNIEFPHYMWVSQLDSDKVFTYQCPYSKIYPSLEGNQVSASEEETN
jgi:hypothetical protein